MGGVLWKMPTFWQKYSDNSRHKTEDIITENKKISELFRIFLTGFCLVKYCEQKGENC